MRVNVRNVEADIQTLADRDVATWQAMPSRLIHVLAPRLDIDVEVASGVSDRKTVEPLYPGARFRIASVTKSFVGAAALRLVEQGRLSLDASLDALLPEEYVTMLRTRGYDTRAITLGHLLTHTSGIYDFAASANYGDDDAFDLAVAADPRHRWTRAELVMFAMDHGEPYGEPGERYGYSCTNANLVGEILERTTEQGMGEAIASLVGFERLGISHTYLETIDPEPDGHVPWARQYEGDVDIVTIDPSIELWGCGGLVSTSRDLGRFFRALLRGEIFEHGSTLSHLTSGGYVDDRQTRYLRTHSTFLFRTEIAGRAWWGHSGYWGTLAYTCPALDVTIVAGHQQAHMPKEFDGYSVITNVAALIADDVAAPA